MQDSVKILACVDYGTGGLKVGIQRIKKNDDETTTDVEIVKLCPLYTEAEQKIIWDDDPSKLVYGQTHINAHLKAHPEAEQDIIAFLKLALCDDFRDTTVARHVYDRARIPPKDYQDGLTEFAYIQLGELLKDHLCVVKTEILQFIVRNDPRGSSTLANLEKVPFETKLTVPVMWNDMARETMKAAAVDAGFGLVQLHFEPFSVASKVSEQTIRGWKMKEGDVLFIMDGGCGTFDGAIIKIVRSRQYAARLAFTVLGRPVGALLGGWIVNTRICFEVTGISRNGEQTGEPCQHILGQGGLDKYCESLGLSRSQLYAKVEQAAEVLKKEHSLSARRYPIYIDGAEGAPLHSDCIELSEVTIEKAFDEQIRQIMEVTKERLRDDDTPKVNTAVLSGGSFKSRYVMDRLSEQLEVMGIKAINPDIAMAVVHGSLGKFYPKPEYFSPPSHARWFLARDQEWNITLHKDDRTVTKSQNGIHEPIASAVKNVAGVENARLLPDRLFQLMETGNFREDPVLSPPIHLGWDVDVEKPQCIHIRPYFTVDPVVKQYQGAFDQDGRLRDGLSCWRTKLWWYLPSLKDLGFSAVQMNGRTIREVHGLVYCRQTTSDCIEVVVDVYKPDVDLKAIYEDETIENEPVRYGVGEEPISTLDRDLFAFTLTRELWHAFHSHEISNFGIDPIHSKKGSQDPKMTRKSDRVSAASTMQPSTGLIAQATTSLATRLDLEDSDWDDEDISPRKHVKSEDSDPDWSPYTSPSPPHKRRKVRG